MGDNETQVNTGLPHDPMADVLDAMLRPADVARRRDELRQTIKALRADLEALHHVMAIPDVQETEAILPLRVFADDIDRALIELRAVGDRFVNVAREMVLKIDGADAIDMCELGAMIRYAAAIEDRRNTLPDNLSEVILTHGHYSLSDHRCKCATAAYTREEWGDHVANAIRAAAQKGDQDA